MVDPQAKIELRRISVVSWNNAEIGYLEKVSCEVINDVAFFEIENPQTRCATILSSQLITVKMDLPNAVPAGQFSPWISVSEVFGKKHLSLESHNFF